MERLSQSDLSILLAEPSAMQRKVIEQELNLEQVTAIDHATSVQEALQQAITLRPDLIASAYYFEDGTAIDLVEQLRQHPELHDTPFMLVSSETRHEQLEALRQAGVIAILPKPFSRQHLNNALCATVDLLSPEELELDSGDIQLLNALVVDDSPLARKMISRVLSNLGVLNIVEAENGAEAQTRLQEHQVDFVVTDLNMPYVDGEELTRFIRGNRSLSHLPVLMVTSERDETKLSLLNHSGIDALVDKPFSPQEVRRLLHSVLEA